MLTFHEVHERNIAVEAELTAVCPVESIRYPSDDPATWSFEPAAGATKQQIAAGQAVLRGLDTVKVIEKTAKKKRRDAIAAMDADVVKLLRAIHARLMVIEHSRQTFDEWRDYVLGVDDLQSVNKK